MEMLKKILLYLIHGGRGIIADSDVKIYLTMMKRPNKTRYFVMHILFPRNHEYYTNNIVLQVPRSCYLVAKQEFTAVSSLHLLTNA